MATFFIFLIGVSVILGIFLFTVIADRNRERDRRGFVAWYLPDGKYQFIGEIMYRGTVTALMVDERGCRRTVDWIGEAESGDTVIYSNGNYRVFSALAPPEDHEQCG